MSTEQKGLGKKIKRLFLEEGDGDGGPAQTSPADEVAHIAQQAAPTPQAPSSSVTGAQVEPAQVDFAGIYRTAGLSQEELDEVDRTQKLLRTLPANLPLETQKQILEGTLKTFGIAPGRIRQTIARQQRSMVAYAGVVKQDTEKRDAEARAHIEQLRAEALKLERGIEDRARTRAAVELACKNQGDAVARTIDFLPAGGGTEEK
jgi:hypothetical protein